MSSFSSSGGEADVASNSSNKINPNFTTTPTKSPRTLRVDPTPNSPNRFPAVASTSTSTATPTTSPSKKDKDSSALLLTPPPASPSPREPATPLSPCASKPDDELREACDSNSLSEVQRVLSLGECDVNSKTRYGGTSPLHIAARANSVKIGQELIDRGAQVNAQSFDGITPLMWAGGKGNHEFSILLINNSADISMGDGEGLTPLHYACRSGQIHIVLLLLEHGASPYEVDGAGKDCFEYCDLKRLTRDFIELNYQRALVKAGEKKAPQL